MKPCKKFITVVVSTALFIFAVVAFCEWSIDPSEWLQVSRIIAAGIWMFVTAVSVPIVLVD